MTDTISGVTSLSGTPTRARVTLIDSTTNTVVSSIFSAESTGAWAFPNLPAGTYEVLIVKQGYKAQCDGPWTLDGIDTYAANVVSLLHFNGADGSTTFTDETGKAWTPVGDAQIDTAQSKFGGASGLFDGAGDYLSTPDSDDFYLSADFTIEAWIRSAVTGAAGVFIPIYTHTASLGSNNNRIMFDLSSGFMTLSVQTTVTNWIVAQTAYAIPADTWVHVAITREGNLYRLFVNGVLIHTATQTNAMPNIAGSAYIGTQRNASAQRYLNGHLDELRVTNGVARYVTDFVPPVGPFTL